MERPSPKRPAFAFLSALFFIYTLIVLPIFIPFLIWLFVQGQISNFLGIFGLIYLFFICLSAWYLNQFLIKTLRLRYKENAATMEIQIGLRNALANNEFFLLYQPIINLKTGQISAVEALLRWNHPTKGIIQPLKFIPVAEESKIIVLLGEWVFRRACSQNKIWQKMGLRPIQIAINVSGIQLMRYNFADRIRLALDDIELDPQYVDIELTESIIMDDKKQNLRTLQRLNKMGINLTIDDFGKGYSSLNYLHEFPVNKLKIDQSFIRNCNVSKNGTSIVDAIITMGHGLNLKVLAEGIETIEQLRFLKESGCDEGQGFFYDEPMNADAFTKLLRADSKYD